MNPLRTFADRVCIQGCVFVYDGYNFSVCHAWSRTRENGVNVLKVASNLL